MLGEIFLNLDNPIYRTLTGIKKISGPRRRSRGEGDAVGVRDINTG